MGYVGLHQHTVYSLLDGYCKIPDLVRKSKDLGWNSTAITDHNHLGGIPEFQQECFKQGIKPLLGMEGYYTFSTRLLSLPVKDRNELAERDAILSGTIDRDKIKKLKSTELTKLHRKYGYDTTSYHILFIAKNQKGWQNLVKLQSESSKLCTFNGRYHCDMQLLRKYHEGIICTTACIGSFPSEMISLKRFMFVENYLLQMQDIFQDDFYLEIQPLNNRRQQVTNWYYYKWGKEHGIKTVATNDSHWVNMEDAIEHDVLLCVGIGAKKADIARMQYEPVFWVRSQEEMISAFEEQANNMIGKVEGFEEKHVKQYSAYYQKALMTTQEVADKVDPDIRLGSERHLFPSVKIEEGKTAEEVLREKAQEGLKRYLLKNDNLDKKTYEDQLKEELEIICSKGFAPYFLTVEEMISWCDSNNVPTGPGRGSAAGSLTLLCLGVTKKIDPIQMKLWFSRFMTKDRTAMPDVDVDVSWSKRDKVIEHLESAYGKPNVSHIGTFTTLKVKSAIKDVARVLGVPFVEALQISKAIDKLSEDPNLSFKIIDSWAEGTLDERKLYKQFCEVEERYQEVFSFARKFEGIPRQMGIHASGILVTPTPVDDIFPVRYVDGVAVTLWTGVQLDEMNALKLDVLGLKTCDILDVTLKSIDKELTVLDLYEKVDINDSNIYQLIRDKRTDAVFQLESDVMKNIINEIKPVNFDDIIAINALARPGPLSCNMHVDYAKVKSGEKKISYFIRGCEDILDITYGVIAYQEQLMAISKRIAGFDDNQADSLTRKVVAKKKPEMMKMLIRCHIYGKKNCEGPEGWETNDNLPWYDPKRKYGGEIEGALKHGYSKDEILRFFRDIEDFASYAFNKSHSASYSFISVCTAWLKFYYPIDFWAAVLSITDDERKEKYLELLEREGISICTPDINSSGTNFCAVNNKILYGLGGIKGLGPNTVVHILEEREKGGSFLSISDAIERLSKRTFNQKVIIALIKAGAFDFEDKNRCRLINSVLDIKKDKKTARFNEDNWGKDICQNMEREVLNAAITYKDWWRQISEGDTIKNKLAKIMNLTERKDKTGALMAFCSLVIDNSVFEAIIFASIYAKSAAAVLTKGVKEVVVTGRKNNGKLIISSVSKPVEE